MGGQEKGSGQRLRGGGHAGRPLDRALRRDIYDDGDLGRWWLYQRHRRGNLHQGSSLVPGTLWICSQPRFR